MRKPIIAAAFALTSSLALAQAVPTNGEVTKVDAAQGKITLKHEPIKNLDMDAMTMVFRAGEPSMLSAVKPGDRVVFEADRVNGQLTITKMRKAQ
jgi:Cu/Ag efflux protein CusF